MHAEPGSREPAVPETMGFEMPGAPVTPLAGPIAREAHSFEALYRAHHGFVWRCLHRLGVPDAMVEDALQEVFVTAYRRMETFEGRASLRAWLGGIARKVAFRHRRSNQRHERRKDALAQLPGDQANVEDWMRRREADVFLDAFLDNLDADKRAVFVMCDLEGMRGREAAEALGVNPNTASARLRAARALFHRACKQAATDGFPHVEDDVARVAAETRPPRGAEQRGWAAIGIQIGTGSALAASGTAGAASVSIVAAPAAGGAKAAGLGGTVKALVVSMALGGAGAVITTRALDREDRDAAPALAAAQARPTPRTPTRAAAPVPSRSLPRAEKAPPLEPPAAATPVQRPTGDAPPTRTTAAIDPLQLEMDLLDAAKQAADAGKWTAALNYARQYRRDHETFAQEATKIEVQALCALDKRDDALAAATAALGSTRGKLLVERKCPR